MPAPSKAWTVIATAATDPDSPLDTTLITAIADNLTHVRETVYDPAIHTPALAHTHDGIDSVQISGNIAGALYMFRYYF